FQGALADRQFGVRATPNEIGPHIGLAEALEWVGDFDGARTAFASAKALAERQNDRATMDDIAFALDAVEMMAARSDASPAADACMAAVMRVERPRREDIGDCTRAFFDATDPEGKADSLTSRGLLWLRLPDHDAFYLDDFRIAAALVPNDAGLRSNL